MNYQGTQTLDHPVQRVWDALLDPAVLRESIAGCESFERTSDNEFASKVKVSIGPVSARFASTMTLADMAAPHALTLNFSGQGGVAGFGKGQARVTLSELNPAQTQLNWQADAQVGGKLAQLGSRLIEGSVRKMSESFFECFAAQLSRQAQPVAQSTAEVATDNGVASTAFTAPRGAANESPRPACRSSRWIWGATALLAAGAVLAWQLGR